MVLSVGNYSYNTYEEKLSNNQEPLEFTIITFILMALTFDSGVILLGKIRCPSLLGKKFK